MEPLRHEIFTSPLPLVHQRLKINLFNRDTVFSVLELLSLSSFLQSCYNVQLRLCNDCFCSLLWRQPTYYILIFHIRNSVIFPKQSSQENAHCSIRNSSISRDPPGPPPLLFHPSNILNYSARSTDKLFLAVSLHQTQFRTFCQSCSVV